MTPYTSRHHTSRSRHWRDARVRLLGCIMRASSRSSKLGRGLFGGGVRTRSRTSAICIQKPRLALMLPCVVGGGGVGGEMHSRISIYIFRNTHTHTHAHTTTHRTLTHPLPPRTECAYILLNMRIIDCMLSFCYDAAAVVRRGRRGRGRQSDPCRLLLNACAYKHARAQGSRTPLGLTEGASVRSHSAQNLISVAFAFSFYVHYFVTIAINEHTHTHARDAHRRTHAAHAHIQPSFVAHTSSNRTSAGASRAGIHRQGKMQRSYVCVCVCCVRWLEVCCGCARVSNGENLLTCGDAFVYAVDVEVLTHADPEHARCTQILTCTRRKCCMYSCVCGIVAIAQRPHCYVNLSSAILFYSPIHAYVSTPTCLHMPRTQCVCVCVDTITK